MDFKSINRKESTTITRGIFVVGSKGANKKHEFTYLKNAATEIYNLLRKTRTEGSEEKKKFEEDLSEIVKMVEEKEKMVTFLEKRVDEQTKARVPYFNQRECVMF